jgi:hypothetical protein
MKDVSDLSGATSAATATLHIHALHVSDDRYKSGCAHARRALPRSGSASSVLRHVKGPSA